MDNLRNTDLVMRDLFWIGVYLGINKEKISYIVKVFDGYLNKK